MINTSKYRAFHILAQIYTANHATFPIQISQYRFAVISEEPSIMLLTMLRSKMILPGAYSGREKLERKRSAQFFCLLPSLKMPPPPPKKKNFPNHHKKTTLKPQA